MSPGDAREEEHLAAEGVRRVLDGLYDEDADGGWERQLAGWQDGCAPCRSLY